MASRTLAMDVDGNMSWCTVPAEDRGKNRCHHVGHHEEGESIQEFAKRGEELNKDYYPDFPKMTVITNPYAGMYENIVPGLAISRLDEAYKSSSVWTENPDELDVFEDIKREDFEGQQVFSDESSLPHEFNDEDFEYAKDTHDALKFLATTNVYARTPFPGMPPLGEVGPADVFNQELKEMGVKDSRAREKLLVAMSWYEMNGATDNGLDDEYTITESRLSEPDGVLDTWYELADKHFIEKKDFCKSVDHMPNIPQHAKNAVKNWAILHSKEMSIMPRNISAANRVGETEPLEFNRLLDDIKNSENESGKLSVASNFVNKHPEFYSEDVFIARDLGDSVAADNNLAQYQAWKNSNRMI